MQKKHTNITFCYLLCLSLSLSFISTTKEVNSNITLDSNNTVILCLNEKAQKQFKIFNKNIKQFNKQFNDNNFAIGAIGLLNIGGATVTTCLALKKIMDNHGEDKDNKAAFGVLLASLVWHSIGWGILYRKEIRNLLFGK